MPKQASAKTGGDRVRPLVAYYATLVVLAFVSFSPHGRIWGFNWWGYYPAWVPIALFVVGAIILLLFLYEQDHELTDEGKPSGRMFWFVGGLIAVALIVSFCTLYNRTHFLGDGYLVISLLAGVQPAVKFSEVGESLVHIWVRDLLGGASDTASIMSYRVTSIVSGIIFIIATMIASSKLFRATGLRVLFFLGMLTGGYMLLFFGYAENYSLLALSVGVYVFMGMLIVRNRLSRWWILIPQLLAVFFHLFGVLLLPATGYILIQGTAASRRWSRLTKSARRFLIGAIVVFLLVTFFYAQSHYLFFRLAVLPFAPHRLTVAGYTLFSLAHLIDYANLLFVLLPGLFLFLVAFPWRQWKSRLSDKVTCFQLVAIGCCLGAAFIFEPKLGMPRDWDLFAMGGIPLASFVYWQLLHNRRSGAYSSVLAVALGLFVLGPRVVSQVLPDISLAHVYNYKDIDRIKSRNLYSPLIQYLKQIGRDDELNRLYSEWNRRFPVRLQSLEIPQLLSARQYVRAKEMAGYLLEKNPLLHGVWNSLGFAYYSLGMVDSAIYCYRLSLGLNPESAATKGNLALALIDVKKVDEADRLLDQAIAIDSTHATFFSQKARIARTKGRYVDYVNYLTRAASKKDAEPATILELLAVELQRGDVERARYLLNSALDHGLDSAYADSLAAKRPELLPIRKTP